MASVQVKYPKKQVAAPFFASGRAPSDAFAVTGVLLKRDGSPIAGATVALLEPGHGHGHKRWLILFPGPIPDGDYTLAVTGFVEGRDPSTDDSTVVRVRVINSEILDIVSHSDDDNITDEVDDFMPYGTYNRPAGEVRMTPSVGEALSAYYISNQSGVWAAFFDAIPRPQTSPEYYTLTAKDIDNNQAEPAERLTVDPL
jgi:hypothetical protein